MRKLVISSSIFCAAAAVLGWSLWHATANAQPTPASEPPRQGQPGDRPRPPKTGDNKGLIKPKMEDTIKANIYADNWFCMYVNNKLVCVDSIDFIPHNVMSIDLLPQYPMTIAIMARDNADPKTGLEYGDHIGDGG